MPPTFTLALPVLDDFLGWLPENVRAAFEFRHASWHVPEVFERLRRRNAALCITETAGSAASRRGIRGAGSRVGTQEASGCEPRRGARELMSAPLVMTADFGYFRLRDEGYTADDLRQWAGRLRQQHTRRRDIFVYFKHEEAGKGPEFARQLMRLLDM